MSKITPKQFLAVVKTFFSDIKLLSKKGEDVLFNPEAEEYVVKLLQIQEVVEEALEHIKSQVILEGDKVFPGSKGFKGAYIDGIKRKYGDKYWYDKSKTSDLTPYLREVKYFKVDSEKVDEYLETVGELPTGIMENQREEQLTIKLKDESKKLHLLE